MFGDSIKKSIKRSRKSSGDKEEIILHDDYDKESDQSSTSNNKTTKMQDQDKSTDSRKNSSTFEMNQKQGKCGACNPAMELDETDLTMIGDGGPFQRSISISNPEAVDLDELVKKLRERFQKKVRKCEVRIKFYSGCESLMTLALLSLQVLQMAIQPLRDVWLSNETLVILQNILIAITALLAGLQLKMKFNDRADRYRKGVKIYHHLLKITSYYSIMAESGGRPDYENSIRLWQEALNKELVSLESDNDS
uniref:uncharacterized protein LOC120340939 n=1 Tax=Styela clava TaxID=7725 RepID=UPI0019396672|nr:uncharacterized protein LOC120340939 [Styela clava]